MADDQLKGLMSLHGQLTTRLGRLERDQKALAAQSGEDDELARLMDQALSRFWAEWDAGPDALPR